MLAHASGIGAGPWREEKMRAFPLRVLLVEDSLLDVAFLQGQLGQERHGSRRLELVHAPDLAYGLAQLRADVFDVILLDLFLPDAQGLDGLRRLRDTEPDVPIVVLTGTTDEDVATQALRLGAQDYLVKGTVSGPTLARALLHAVERHRLLQEVNSSALVDDLTGLYNRRGLQVVAAPLWKGLSRGGKGILLMFIDLDGLKGINDTLGHAEGDLALRDTAVVLRAAFRQSDTVARLSGDEFAVLCAGAGLDDVKTLESRLQNQVRAHNEHHERKYQLALSVGASHCDPAQPVSLHALLVQADANMYEQKRARRQSSPTRPYLDCAVSS
jgi:two-component system cell cycle response regulator